MFLIEYQKFHKAFVQLLQQIFFQNFDFLVSLVYYNELVQLKYGYLLFLDNCMSVLINLILQLEFQLNFGKALIEKGNEKLNL